MNPFDLPGPQFLVFYLVFGLVILLVVSVLRHRAEFGTVPKIDFSDPYLIAYLRGGENEALRIAAFSLLDRGILTAQDETLEAEKNVSLDEVRRPIEKSLLKKFTQPHKATVIFGDPALVASCTEYEKTLTRLSLLPDEETKRQRWRRFFFAFAVLGGVALLKIVIALSRGRHNIFFLMILAVVFMLVVAKVSHPFRTARGNILLADVRTLFAALKKRVWGLRPGGATSEAVLLAAVFGLGVLPEILFPHLKRLYPQSTSLSSRSSCGSSCGASCGSSCGGGGGGGGGGCGGCGGD
jgi:uncharacterized protein (TIGR04222 family)